MTTPKMTKFRALKEFDNALRALFYVGFNLDEIKEIVKFNLSELKKEINNVNPQN